MATFTAKLAAGFEEQETQLYEVVTGEGERIASTTDEYEASSLASKLNNTLECWAAMVGPDAVIN